MIERQIKNQIEKLLGGKKAIVIMGARQVGKSTLLNELFPDKNDALFLNGDDVDVQDLFENMTAERMKAYIGNKHFIVIDEAQRIADIGLRLKLVTDRIDGVQVVATGSSSFQLASKLNETLTGRKREFQMFPITFKEMVDHTDLLTEMRMLPHRMMYGYYPEVVIAAGDEREVLRELTNSYLYKDILQLDGVSKPDKLMKLLQALARQIGEQVSYREIGMLIDLDPKTVEKYIDVLEKSYIIFRLGSYARNLRNELKSSKKIYFHDLGIRNAVIGDFRPVETRVDIGSMWENFVIAERMKQIAYSRSFTNLWFWRTLQQKEIDLIEEVDGGITAVEFKWNAKKANAKMPTAFAQAYPDAKFKVITPANIDEYLLP
jgi:hypothetical protein